MGVLEKNKETMKLLNFVLGMALGARKPAEIPNLKPAVSDFVREYLLRNQQDQWILKCLTNPKACEKVVKDNMEAPPEAVSVMPNYEEEIILPDDYYLDSK